MKKKAGILLFLKCARLAISIFNIYLSAFFFGVSIERDTWILALSAFLIFDMALWGPINETFRAKFIFLKAEHGEDQALKKTGALLLLTSFVTLLFVTIVLWKPELISTIIAPNYKGEKLALLLFMIRVIAPTFLFNQITQILSAILNAYNSINIPEIAGFVSGLINLLLVLLLAPTVGILSLVYSYYASLFILLVLLVFQIKSLQVRLFVNIVECKLADAWPFILFSLPFFLPYFIGQVALIVEKSISSSLAAGVVSSLDYARKFSDILIGILLSILLTIFVPLLSSHFMKNNAKGFIFELRQVFQFGFLIITSFVSMFTACPHAIIAILYRSGNISPSALTQIGNLAMGYSWCAVAIFLYYIFGIALLSAKKQKYYAFYGSIAQLIMIGLNLLLYEKIGVYVFPLSLFISHLLAAFLMFRKFPFGKNEILIPIIRYFVLLLGVVSILYLLNVHVIIFRSAYLVFLVNIFVLMIILTAILFIFKLDEHLVLLKMCRKVFKAIRI